MNIAGLLTRYEGNVKGNIRIGSDMTCIFNGESCPHLQCGTNRNPNRALYHKIRAISIAPSGEIKIDISPFYEETKGFDLRDLLMVSFINDIQIDDNLRIVGRPMIEEYIRNDTAALYKTVKKVSIVEGVMFITLAPSIDEIMRMIMID